MWGGGGGGGAPSQTRASFLPSRVRSSFSRRAIAATFGHPGKLGPNPKEFLKRGEKAVKIPARNPDLQKFNYPEDQRKVYVPKRDEKPVMGLKTSKNFITANAVEAILQVTVTNRTAE